MKKRSSRATRTCIGVQYCQYIAMVHGQMVTWETRNRRSIGTAIAPRTKHVCIHPHTHMHML